MKNIIHYYYEGYILSDIIFIKSSKNKNTLYIILCKRNLNNLYGIVLFAYKIRKIFLLAL